MMKKTALLNTAAALIFFFNTANKLCAQSLGTGTGNPDASAQLDITSLNKGLLMPRMASPAVIIISNPAKGLMVYDSVKNQLVINTGTSATPAWQDIAAGAGWALTGNAGTNSATDFIGTTDRRPLLIRVAGRLSGLIDSVSRDTYIGLGAGINSSGDSANTAVGFQSLYSNTSGYNNTAVGCLALNSTLTGTNNTANGYQALYYNTSYNNTANGYGSLYSNTSGFINTATGHNALQHNGNGYSNTGSGAHALASGTTAVGNTANGFFAISSGTLFDSDNTGDFNTGSGTNSLQNNTTGAYNTATGRNALGSNSIGRFNTGDGADALSFNITGSYNTVFGSRTISNTYTISQNTAIGFNSLLSTNNADGNTAIGFDAGFDHGNGYYNCFIGTANDANGTGYYNTISIGHAALVTAPSMLRVGNGATTSIGGPVNWSTVSDSRIKKNVRENIPGLAFINRLRPVSYTIDVAAMNKLLSRSAGKGKSGKIVEKPVPEQMIAAYQAKERILYTGFVAQEVAQAANLADFDFSGIDAPKNNNDLYGLRYDAFVVPLVESVKELAVQTGQINKDTELLKKAYSEIEERLNMLEKKAR